MKQLLMTLIISTILIVPALAGDADQCARQGHVAKLVAQARDDGMTLQLAKHMLRDTGMSSFQNMATLIFKEKGHSPAEFEETVTKACLVKQ